MSGMRGALRVVGVAVIPALLVCFLAGCRSATQSGIDLLSPKSSQHFTGKTACQRVVSLSPGITETLYALDLGDRVVGVTRFCRYPPEARLKPAIGGYLDPNPEAILRLKPDLVVLPDTRQELIHRFAAWQIPVLPVNDRRLEGLLASFRNIGTVCHREAQAGALISRTTKGIDRIRRRGQQGASRPSVLIVVDRALGDGPIRRAYVVGEDGFYSRLIRLAGGKNALPESQRGFPRLSGEGILRLNPDIIIEFLPMADQRALSTGRALAGWRQMPELSAVRNGRIHLMTEDYMTIPGPRLLLTLERLAEAVRSERGHEK